MCYLLSLVHNDEAAALFVINNFCVFVVYFKSALVTTLYTSRLMAALLIF